MPDVEVRVLPGIMAQFNNLDGVTISIRNEKDYVWCIPCNENGIVPSSQLPCWQESALIKNAPKPEFHPDRDLPPDSLDNVRQKALGDLV